MNKADTGRFFTIHYPVLACLEGVRTQRLLARLAWRKPSAPRLIHHQEQHAHGAAD